MLAVAVLCNHLTLQFARRIPAPQATPRAAIRIVWQERNVPRHARRQQHRSQGSISTRTSSCMISQWPTEAPWEPKPRRRRRRRRRPSHAWPNCCINQAPLQPRPIYIRRTATISTWMRIEQASWNWAWDWERRRHVVCPGKGAYVIYVPLVSV